MKIFIFLFLEIQSAAAVTHSLQYFYTASSGVNNFPEFVSVGLVDGQQITYYDSNIKRAIPKQDWMEKNEGPDYWERETQISTSTEQVYKSNIQIAKQRFNQTGGFHVVQMMYGCEWDDETGEVKGYSQYGYDGEDFIALDIKSKSWIAPKPQAVITKHKWDNDKAWIETMQNYLTQECPEWLKKYVNYGRSSLMRTDRPSVSLLQKTSSSPVTCHASGFYPPKAEMFWRKDGEEDHVGVEKGEILPNNDGTFQMSVELSSVAPEDWSRYECVFQLSGVKEDIETRLEKPRIRTNEDAGLIDKRGKARETESGPNEDNTVTNNKQQEPANSNILIICIVVVVVLSVVVVIGFILYNKRNAGESPEVREEMLPTA